MQKQNCISNTGGDFNVSEQWDEKYNGWDPSHKLVFDRLEDFGLINCTNKIHGKHVQTHYHKKSSYEWQADYLFVSWNLEKYITKCDVINNIEMNCSDHIPVAIELNFNINSEINKAIYEGDPKSFNPLFRWGSSMSVKRSRAFEDYKSDYNAAGKKWPAWFSKQLYSIPLHFKQNSKCESSYYHPARRSRRITSTTTPYTTTEK